MGLTTVNDGQRTEAVNLIRLYTGKRKYLVKLKECVLSGEVLADHQVRIILRHYKRL